MKQDGVCYAILKDGTIKYPVSYARASVEGFVSVIAANGMIKDIPIVALAISEDEANAKRHEYLKRKGAIA